MTEEERARLTWEYCEAHRHEWDAYLARPIADREADQEKIMQALKQGGPLAGRAMAKALGHPTIPDDLCDPLEVLEARAAQDEEEDAELWGEVAGAVEH